MTTKGSAKTIDQVGCVCHIGDPIPLFCRGNPEMGKNWCLRATASSVLI
jgi:hypothetical protein